MKSHRIKLLLAAFLITLNTWADGHVYKGSQTYSSNILYTWDGKHLYKGSQSYSSNILYTWDGKHLYKGSQTYSSNILYTTDTPLPPIFFTLF